MCNQWCIDVGHHLTKDQIFDKDVIEVGSFNVNGSLRQSILSMSPAKYIGTDMQEGPGVDVICKAEDLLAMFGEHSFDAVISTEMLEHVNDWRLIVHNLKMLLRPGGVLLITTRSRGFPLHSFPFDFWRFEREHFMQIFSDMKNVIVDTDPSAPGVSVVAIMPKTGFVENDLSSITPFDINSGT